MGLRIANLSAFLLLIPAACHCTPLDEGVREAYFAGDYGSAHSKIGDLSDGDASNAHLWGLEQGLIELADGRLNDSARSLNAAREGVVAHNPYAYGTWSDPATILDQASATLKDDRSLPYEGRDYEQLMMYSILTLVELLRGGGDAVPNAYQGQDKLLTSFPEYEDPSGERPKTQYHPVAFGDYLYAAFREESATHIDTARRTYARFLEMEPDYRFGQDDRDRLEGKTRRDPEAGVLYVLPFVGRGPMIEENVLQQPTAAALAWLELIWSNRQGKGTLPILQDIKVPRLVLHEEDIGSIEVSVDGNVFGSTATITDVNRCAQAEFKAMYDTIVLRATVRRLVKILVKEGSKALAGDHKEYSWVDLGVDVLANLWVAAECADLRCWSLLPSKVQALRIEVPPGDHEISLSALDSGGRPLGTRRSTQVRIARGLHSYLFGVFSDSQTASDLVSSSPATVLE